jgi:hypothetical protein
MGQGGGGNNNGGASQANNNAARIQYLQNPTVGKTSQNFFLYPIIDHYLVSHQLFLFLLNK